MKTKQDRLKRIVAVGTMAVVLSGVAVQAKEAGPPDPLFLNIEKDKIDIRVRNNESKEGHSDFGYTYDVETTLQPKDAE